MENIEKLSEISAIEEGVLIVVSGPSGAGKGAICSAIIERNKDLHFSVSMTTRKPRENEVDGVDYYFVSEEEFKRRIEGDELLEYAKVHNNYYGTPKREVFDNLKSGKSLLLDIESKGARQIKSRFSNAVYVFVLPPTIKDLVERILKRGSETRETLELRLKNGIEELENIGMYDYFIINEDLDDAIRVFNSIFEVEKHKISRKLKSLKLFVNDLKKEGYSV